MTNSLIKRTEEVLLAPTELTHQTLEKILASVAGPQTDYADVFLQHSHTEGWVLENGVVRDAYFSLEHGAGLRVISGEQTGFAYTDNLSEQALQQVAAAASSIVRMGGSGKVSPLAAASVASLYTAKNPILSWESEQKVALLQRLDAFTRSLDPAVCEVSASLHAAHDNIMVAATDGTYGADIRPLVRFNISVIVERNGRRERGSAGGGGRVTYDWLLEDARVEAWAKEAVRIALLNLDAKDAPAGIFPVVLGPGWPGVLLHEAVGHGLEGDFNRKGTSVYADQMGQMVASPLCTVVDDGTLTHRRGSLTIDDEGTPTQVNTLIENGRLVKYMQDKHNARLAGYTPTGNGRRESYAHLPMPRMTNTYMLPGESEPEEILASLDKGLYAVNFGGGQVDITSGRFVFSTSEAYWVENGKIQYPVKGATLMGSGADVMRGISMVGNDLALDSGVGVCGKDGQSVPVGVGQPSLRVEALTVGGTAS